MTNLLADPTPLASRRLMLLYATRPVFFLSSSTLIRPTSQSGDAPYFPAVIFRLAVFTEAVYRPSNYGKCSESAISARRTILSPCARPPCIRAVMPNTHPRHRRLRRELTVKLRRVGGVYRDSGKGLIFTEFSPAPATPLRS